MLAFAAVVVDRIIQSTGEVEEHGDIGRDGDIYTVFSLQQRDAVLTSLSVDGWEIKASSVQNHPARGGATRIVETIYLQRVRQGLGR